jgi:cobalt-zinc-cadmium efflux system outer membrane protein
MLLVSGCLYHAREETDALLANLAARPYDVQPATETEQAAPMPPAEAVNPPGLPMDLQTTAWMLTGAAQQPPPGTRPKYELTIPPEIPGSEAKHLQLPTQPAEKLRYIDQTYPTLPALRAEPMPQPGPGGKAYTLADFQQLAAAYSPTLRQAAADVEAAKGNLIQARAYPNPTVGWQVQPSNDGSTAGVQGPFIDQTIKTGGKLKLAAAVAEMDLRNAELALKRARSDLSTAVRNAYFGVLVAKETVRVNKALAHFTDEIYRIQADLLRGGFAATYEPAGLRAQAYTIRLAYNQAIQNYVYAWKQLVATIGLRQLPLSEVAGRIDAFLPYFDYDAVLAHVRSNHTDVLTARNGLDKARYSLKLAQVTPIPDVDFNVAFLKEFSLPPKQAVHTATIGFPLPIWDQNRGNIIAQEAAVVRATEEPHRVETNLTNMLATSYANYKNALEALEYYRRYILPDQVRYYRGVFDRRQVFGDVAGVAFGDLVQAQQTLATNVGTYLTILGQLWTSVVSVADLLQTDDLFQLAQPQEVPALPDLEHLTPWPCCHAGAPCGSPGEVHAGEALPGPAAGSGPMPPAEMELPAPKPLIAPPDPETNLSVPLGLMRAPAVLLPAVPDPPPPTAPTVSGWHSRSRTVP